LGIGVKKHSQIAPALLTDNALPDGPLSLINRPIPRALCQDSAETATGQGNREQGEGRQNHISNYNVFQEVSFTVAD
jgi:hypothetical protein